ncbi:MAG TPA: hypothetical protein VMB74_12485 [Streptosporangiaceae bacterium]|nr:hypothetical protein [Streptosporangiaceae bacterium]
MLNFRIADVDATPAAMRPLAGSGAGAFTCDGAWDGTSADQFAAVLALPRIRPPFAVGPQVQARTADAYGSGYQGSTVRIGALGSGGSSKQHNQMTRIFPVAPGGVGPHPAREPDPV